MRQHRLSFVVCSGVALFALGAAAMDQAHWFYSLSSADRRAYSNIYGEPLVFQWPNWAKIFFNNKGVAAEETDNCASRPPDDESVWDG
jgi:hypothetical protein